jgi:hypothetical protein
MKPETKTLLKAARDDRTGPTAEARSRMRGKVLAAVGATAVASSTAAAGSAVAGTAGVGVTGAAGAAATGASGLGGAAWAVGAGLAVLAVGGGYLVEARDDASRAAQGEHAAPHAADPVAPQTATVPPIEHGVTGGAKAEPEPTGATVSDAAAPELRARSAEPPPPSGTAARPDDASHSIPEPPAPSADTLAEESALLATARSALASGDSRAALRALGDHATRFPRGVLSAERRALTAMALCADGRVAEGLATFPLPETTLDTPLSKRVRSACAR